MKESIERTGEEGDEGVIRRAKASDLPGINKLLYEVQKVHSDARPDLFRAGAKKYDDEQLVKIIGSDSTPVFVLEKNGQVLGYAFCIFRQVADSNTLTAIKTLYVDDLCVDECARGEHVGRRLYDYVIDFARESGCYNVTLNVWADNESAVGFYKAIGMRVQRIGMEKIL